MIVTSTRLPAQQLHTAAGKKLTISPENNNPDRFEARALDIALVASAGAFLGAGMQQGGPVGALCGTLAGATAGRVFSGPNRYACTAAGAIAGALAGLHGVPYASLGLAATLGAVQAFRH